MIEKAIVIELGDTKLDITAFLNSIIAFVMSILGKEVPEIKDVLGE